MEYAALVSLLHITDEILDFDDSELRFFPFTKEKIESFKETIDSLLEFLDKYPPICSGGVQDLMTEIREASYEAEEILESLIRTHFLQKDGRDRYQRFPENNFEQIVKKLEWINIEVWKIQLDRGVPALDNDMEMQLRKQLVGGRSELVVIPIVGPGGIGKTTLARTLYDSQLVKENFDIRGWGTISQTYNVREIVENILKVIGGVPYGGKEDVERYLYRTLRGGKYLIVLDDVWDTHAWDDIKMLFPESNNGSRVILTTRIYDVAMGANSYRTYHMDCLSKDSSWSLFCQVVFGQKNCPPELVEIGKEIAHLCRGVPLVIYAIGGCLKKEKKTKENWKYISESITSVSKTAADYRGLEMLTFCYNNLPHHLKELFLYFGSFPEDRSIDVFTIVNMWIAEGFVEPSRSKSMEEVAKEYLADIIDRNLVSVDGWDSLGNVKRCRIHDLFRDICIREAEKEKFFHILNWGIPLDPLKIYSQRRLIFSQNIKEDVDPARSSVVSRDGSLLATRSFIFHGDRTLSSTIKLGSGLLKVLKISVKSIVEILELVNLKYLQLGHVSEKIPSSISRLRNLQTFIATCEGAKQDLPSEIWEMLQLRHIVTSGFYLPLIPDVQSKGMSIYGLKNLSTLKEMLDSSCTQEVLRRIPNVKELYIFYTMPFDSSNNLVSLCKLESLHCVFKFKDEPNDNILRNNFFPVSLKKLVLRGCRIPWENLRIIGTLRNLEVLKLKDKAMVGTLWETNVGEFTQLRTLSIEESELKVWNTEVNHFPRLEHLKLEFCSVLEEIPSEIGGIPTLKTIELTKCSRAAESSVKKILGKNNEIGISIISNDAVRPGYGFKVKHFRKQLRYNCSRSL